MISRAASSYIRSVYTVNFALFWGSIGRYSPPTLPPVFVNNVPLERTVLILDKKDQSKKLRLMMMYLPRTRHRFWSKTNIPIIVKTENTFETLCLFPKIQHKENTPQQTPKAENSLLHRMIANGPARYQDRPKIHDQTI